MIFTHEYIEQLYELLEPLRGIVQEPQYHPEKDAYVHSFQVLYHALRETIDTDLIIAALMHDVGKSVNRLGHDKESVELLKDLCSEKTLWFIKEHMRVNYFLSGEMKRPEKACALAEHPWFPKLCQLNRWDKMGRTPNWTFYIPVSELVVRLNDLSKKHFRTKPGLLNDFRQINIEMMCCRSPGEAARHIMQIEAELEKLK